MWVISDLLRRLHREERGSVLLFVVGFLPVAFAMAAFVIDVGNGAEHRRHLQMQADAGALAAAQEFNGCFLDDDAANTAIEDAAIEYAGGTHNPQVGADDPQGRVETRVNATNYTTPSFSAGEPCDKGFVDVKLLEKDSPPVFGFVGHHDFQADARVKIFKLSSSNKLLPIAVPDPDPKVAVARFINESTGAVLATAPLSKNGNENGLLIWDNSSAPVSVPINAEHVGVRIALGGGTSTTCGQAMVSCYDAGSANGLLHIRGWTAAGTGAPKTPIARNVTLLPGSCPDPYFTNADVSCTIGVDATVDFGVPNPATTLGATLAATVAGQSYPLAFDPGTGTWSGSGVTIGAHTGPQDVGLHWQITKNADGTSCNGGQCRGDLAAVHRHFSATAARSGPIARAQVSEGGVTSNTFQRCSALLVSCSHSLVVKIGLLGQLELSTASGPPVRLRIIGGSQNQSLDCDPALSNLRDELAQGCKPLYRPHTSSDPPCPNSTNAFPLPNPPAEWDCVGVEPGNATNQLAQGLNLRVFGTTQPTSCTHPNHWPNWQPGDRRIIFVIVTPFGAFSGSGSTTVPVVRFATFYMTGWTGQGSGTNPCLGQGDEAPTNPAEIVGRFIQYVDTPNNGGAGESTCDFSAIDPCTAVMVE
jgi:Flp pilus assembly protein TadG